ncbi:hypothetical protein [Rubinisphaera margarita]|uniref:hypothetical protein n=1 Tax=Rubinisphaera margarita TaxID=2909586 RepID=UPI001EE7B5CE|nr:hypothetical protein [Rubinisphaera margarita]MCG6155422.1 hypothetical protein [Rubinisphaera margarita]
MTEQQLPDDNAALARVVLQSYQDVLNYTAPERTIHELREDFLKHRGQDALSDFTEGLRFLLERRYIRRLNDERLELTPEGRQWMEQGA